MILKITALGLLLALMGILLRSFGFRGAGAFAALGVATLVSFTAGELSELFGLFGYSELFSEEAMGYVGAIMKIVGAGYIFGIGADICRELGEGGIANGVLVAGRVEIFAITLPYLKKILDIGAELLR